MSQLTYLNGREHATLRAINDVLYPPGGTIPWGANQVGVCEYVDDYVFGMKEKQRRMIRMLFLFLEFAPLLLLRGRTRLSRMTPARCQKFLESLENSRLYFLRIVLISVRTIIGMGFMADSRVQASMGMFANCAYPGDPRKYLTSRDVPGADATIPKEFHHAG
jgi:hypothetical protein